MSKLIPDSKHTALMLAVYVLYPAAIVCGLWWWLT